MFLLNHESSYLLYPQLYQSESEWRMDYKLSFAVSLSKMLDHLGLLSPDIDAAASSQAWQSLILAHVVLLVVSNIL